MLLVEKVLKEKMVRGEKQLLIKWLGYPSSMNGWIPASDILDFTDKPKYSVKTATASKITLRRIK